MRRESFLSLTALLFLVSATLFSGCGSAKKEGGAQGVPATDAAIAIDSANPPQTFPSPPLASTLAGSIDGSAVAVNGTTTCRNCHQQTPTGGNTAIDVFALYQASKHVNQGVGATASSTCLQCHDPFGDGAKLVADGVITTNTAVVGCEACHGGGGMHWGIGPLPANKPGPARCGACHGTAWDSSTTLANVHNNNFPEGNGIYEDYVSSLHARSINSSVLVNTTDVRGNCGRCHTDEGAKVNPIVSGTLASSATPPSPFTEALAGRSNVTNASPVQCRTCHVAHEVGTTTAGRPSLIGQLDAALNATTWSPEFKTCTYCHQLLKTDGTVNVAFHDPSVSPSGQNNEIITDTHFSDPADTNHPPAYNIDPANTRSCSNCHNPHNADNTINNQYAASAHLDRAGSWEAEGDTTSANCQRCHTTTGFINYMGLVAANNNGGTVVTNTASTLPGPGKEMLYCNGCHADNKGGRRDPKVWQYTNGNATSYVIPPGRLPASDVAAINSLGSTLLCAHCHMGRTTGQSVKNSTIATQTAAASAANGDHYYGTFGIMFRTLGYEYDGVGYANTPANTHATIGTAASAAPGNLNGPCVGCHMFPDPGKTAGNHLFKVLTRDANGRAASIIPFNITCSKCHTAGQTERINSINNIESQYSGAIQALRSVFSQRGFFYKLSSNPNTALAGRWFADAAGTTAVSNWPLTAAEAGNPTLGAAFNLRTLDYRLKGKALFHNLVYTKRLVYDSIDFIDDSTINQSVDATIAALTETPAYQNETASEYLITATDKALARAFFGASRP